jgi:hypothetical protein
VDDGARAKVLSYSGDRKGRQICELGSSIVRKHLLEGRKRNG